MPQVRLAKVVEVSSEDEKFPASNLISGKDKWLAATHCTSRQIYAVFELEHESDITGLEIGNCGSAYISVMVSKRGLSEFCEILPQSTFMRPKECKIGSNRLAVKFFSQDDFMKDTKHQKYTLVKIMCSQPFNQNIQFGICFMNIISSTPNSTEPASQSNVTNWKEFKEKCQASSVNIRKSLLNTSSPFQRKSLNSLLSKPDSHQGEEKSKIKNEEETIDYEIFETMVISHLDSMNFKVDELCNFKGEDVRIEFEKFFGRELSIQEQTKFFDILRKYIREIKRSVKNLQNESVESLNDELRMNKISSPKSGSSSIQTSCDRSLSPKDKPSNSDFDPDKLSGSPGIRRNSVSLIDSGIERTDTRSSPLVSKALTSPQSLKSQKRGFTTTGLNTTPTKVMVLDKAQPNASSSNAMIECPICNVYFEECDIVAHSAECGDRASPSPELNVMCPICEKFISKPIIDIHANTCADTLCRE